MSLHQIMYISTATAAVDADQCRAIAYAAAINNRRQDVTGLLLFNSKRFLQVLEGPRDAVERIYAHIGGDARHRALVTLREGSIAAREFGDWGMAFDDPFRPTAILRDKVEALLTTAGPSTRAQFLGSADLHRVA
ncbi:BLUF domain-containing protein [Sphingobium sp. AN558]|uniref:BLUF domain-containing protein n=1 Tax=Sphingobium sp. AN558 TaxID=3133442 RepID=UPI0030C1725F